MNKEVAYVWQGFLLLLVILTGMGIVAKLATSKTTPSPDASLVLTNGQNNSSSNAAYYNPRGELLFKTNCAACHPMNRSMDCDLLDLKRVEERVKDKTLLRAWIRNSDSVLKSGNPYYNALYEKWGKVQKPAFPLLTDQDIDEILNYIRWHRK
jgi:hypothetical protein